MGRPVGPQSSRDVACGDYVRVGAPRAAVSGHGPDEGFARVERIEHLSAGQAEEVFDYRLIRIGPVPTVWCHGLPGPVILRGGDVQVLDVASPQRVEHDTQHPWWPPAPAEPLLRGAHQAGATPPRGRRTPDRTADEVDWPEPGEHDRPQQRATSFTKPASALLVGDYLGVHPNRWPETDRDVDEGFTRVEHLHLLDAAMAGEVFADPSWHTDTVVASVNGISGVLLLRSSDDVAVLAFVNPERAAWDPRNYWSADPVLVLRGSRGPTEDQVRTAAQTDAARRPDVDESGLYPSRFPDPFTRRMVLESKHGFRSVPLAAMPWPHSQSDCPLGELAEQYRDRVPDSHGAHAAAFLSRPGRQIQTECPYHQADWPRLVRMLEESRAAAADDEPPPVGSHPEFDLLCPPEQEWLKALATDPIKYSDGDDALTNGQHRLCALRAAGLTRCSVEGDYLPDTDYGPATRADDDARAEITASWRRMADEYEWPRWIAGMARFLPTAVRAALLSEFRAGPRSRRRRRS